jgi:Na+/H+-dicarboxylate symporter
MGKLVLFHKERAGKVFGMVVGLYVMLGAVALIFAAGWIPILADVPFSLPGIKVPGPAAWAIQIGRTFAGVLAQQPLLQALVGAMVAGWICAKVPVLHPVAYGFIAMSDMILRVFKKLLWYYPIMVGCLAIGIPVKFGSSGMLLYGKCVLWVAILTCTWTVCMMLLCKLSTRRTWKQILSYYGTVWPTGFGTGGAYDTLAVNIVSAEKDMGLDQEVAEVSIVFGTVLNKQCATMCVLLVTITVGRLLNVPVSMAQLLMLIPPVMILGLESPGIPGGAGYFMSPVVAVLLNVPDHGAWVTTFVACYSGLIPMFATGGSMSTDGVVGALLQDRFGQFLSKAEAPKALVGSAS